MKKAKVIHIETVTQYFKDGIEVTPSAQEKLLNVIFKTMEEKTTTFKTELDVIKYKNQNELNTKFWGVAEQFKNFIHPSNLIIER